MRRLRDDLHKDQVRCVYLYDTDVNAADFCRQIALDLGLTPRWSRALTLRSIQQEVQRLVQERHLTVLLIVDEAQGLRPDVLSLVPLLTNYEWDSAGRLAVLLAGQTGLRQKLRMAHLEPLAQRLTIRFALRGFDRETTALYLQHRLKIAGLDRPLFTEPALEALYNASQGIMRRIDTLAHMRSLSPPPRKPHCSNQTTSLRLRRSCDEQDMASSCCPHSLLEGNLRLCPNDIEGATLCT